MPKYKVQPEPMGGAIPTSSKEKRYPTVYLPVSQEIIDANPVDTDVEVTILGKVIAVRSDKDKNEITVELHEVDCYPDDAAEGADDAAEGEGQDGGKGAKKKRNSMKDEIDQGLGYQKG